MIATDISVRCRFLFRGVVGFKRPVLCASGSVRLIVRPSSFAWWRFKSFAAELKVLCCFSKEVLVRNWLEIASVADHRGMIHQRVRGRNLCLLQRGRKFRFVFHLINLLHKD